MKKIISLLGFAALYACPLYADQFSQIAEAQNVLDRTQTNWTNTPFATNIKISGYIKAEGIFDTRQNLTVRDGHFLFYPLNKMPDVLGRDINARGDFDEYAIQTRLRFEAFGPDVYCMQTRSYIEGDFFGRTDDTLDSYRLRHAYLELEASDVTFLAGQTWHPMTIPVEAPDTIGFNSGSPIAPFAREPQFRMVYQTESLDVLGYAGGFVSRRYSGPIGLSNKYFRDSIMPNFHFQTRIKWDTAQNYIGAGIDIMRTVPRLVSNLNYKEVNPFNALSAILYSRFHYNNIVLYSKFTYAENADVWDMIGGFAVHTQDPSTDIRTYIPLRTVSFWSELIFQGKIEPALFMGFVKNLGASERIIQQIGEEQTVYGLGTNINTVFRAAPRLRIYIKAFVLGAEVEYTRATYGTLNDFGKVENTIPIGNTRIYLATYYIF